MSAGSPDLIVICSSSPGFLRGVGALLAGEFRFLECYTLHEAGQMIRLHQPGRAVLDLRAGSARQADRGWATIEQCRSTRFIVVSSHEQADEPMIPREIVGRTEVIRMSDRNPDFAEVGRVLLTTAARATPLTGTSSRGPDNSGELPESCRSDAKVSGHGRPADTDGSATDGPSRTACAVPGSLVSGTDSPIVDRFRTRTPELRQILKRLEVAARHNVTILLIGETGSGKTHLANLIHQVSPRSDSPFLHVACGALPGELIESELFGHVKGAFTSAHADKDGKFLAAGTGTILLDEIDVLAPDQQVKLLRVIERGEFEPVGSNVTLHVKARIIAASNLQLQPLVEQGRFRPDLYYRLNTLSFTIPPLRKRLPDIEPLARYFVHHHASQMGIEVSEILPEFVECLQRYPWPGNVREMENAVRSAVIYSQNGRMTPETLPVHILEGMAGPASDPSVAAFFGVKQGHSLGNRIELTEKDIIEQALLKHQFSRTNTARHLQISRVTLYNKMRKYGILPDRECSAGG